MPKCLCCGRNIPKGEQFVVEKVSKNGNKRKENYCSEKEYLALIEKSENKAKVYKMIDSLFGYKVINNALKKEMENIFNGYDPKLVFSYLESNNDYLSEVMSKQYKNEFCKIRYFSAIISNSIKDFKDIKKEEKQSERKVETIETEVIFNTKFKSRAKRKSLNDIDI